jgi:carboxymethylenebutenolidase
MPTMRKQIAIAAVSLAALVLVAVALTYAQANRSRNQNLPPDADAAVAQLQSSPRHGEWVDIPVRGGAPINSFVIYPERSTKAPVVIVIHEIFGMQDWVRGVADQLAKEGFITISPDLLSGMGPNGGGTASLGDQVGQTIRTLTNEMVVEKLNAVREYALQIPAATGRVGVIGFCWGGGEAFNYALKQPALVAAVSYYGPMPSDPKEYALAEAPILGLYGGADERVDANIPVATTELAKTGSSYEPHVFEGAGHGFLRAQDGQNGANMRATRESWPLVLEFLRKHLEI